VQQRIEWNPTRQLWETEQADLFSGLQEPFSETWPTSGMTRNGQLLPLEMLVPPIGGNECSSLLPTPDTGMTPNGHGRRGGKRGNGHQSGSSLDQVAVELLPTPVAQQSGSTPEEHLARKPGRTQVTDLAIIVENGLME
jgi:hypothetical protein